MIYQQLRQDILRLHLEPGGELDEAVIAARYQVSRTPVREALIRLTAEGLVTSIKGKGARVAALDLQNLRAFFEGLDVLQRSVTRLAARRRRPSDIKTIEAHMLAFEEGARQLDSEKVNNVNYDFHVAIGEAACSGFLAAAYERCLMESLRICYVCFSEHSEIDERLETHLASTMDDHRRLFEALVDGDADRAEACAGEHVELFRNRVVTSLLSIDFVRRFSVHGLNGKY